MSYYVKVMYLEYLARPCTSENLKLSLPVVLEPGEYL